MLETYQSQVATCKQIQVLKDLCKELFWEISGT